MVEAGESEFKALLKTRYLLIFRDAKNAEHGKLRLTGTYLEREMFSLPSRNEIGLRSDTRARPKRPNLAVGFNLEGSWAARDWFRLRLIGREYPELALSFNAVRCEVCMINGKNCGKKFTLRQIHEGAIGKIHGSIPIAGHQTVHVPQFRIFDCTEDQCSGTDEPPGGLHLRARIANEVEQFGENSL
jgi:hypothetical protein